jgi:hypothetical protein
MTSVSDQYRIGEIVTLKDGTRCIVLDKLQPGQTRGWLVGSTSFKSSELPEGKWGMWSCSDSGDYIPGNLFVLCPLSEYSGPLASEPEDDPNIRFTLLELT